MLAKKALAGTAAAPKIYVEDVFSTYLYTGNATARSIVNGIDLATEGGLVWIKNRGQAENNALFDTDRGINKHLFSNTTGAQVTYSGTFTSFNSDGFSLGTDSAGGYVNVNNQTYVSWTFRQAKKFFDVVTYTGNASSRTISHNLGSVPGTIIVKCTSEANDWVVYHRSFATPASSYLKLNTTDAVITGNTNIWDNTAPTSSVFSVGASGFTNNSGQTYVAYLFAHDAGGFGDAGDQSVIKCGSYTGTSAVGNDQDLGFEPQWILIKRNTSGYDWELIDTMRGWAVGGADAQLRPNTSDAEYFATNLIDPTATGFRFSAGGATTLNTSGVTYYYIAIRRGPMKTPTTGTSVFSPNLAATQSQLTTGFPVDLGMWFYRPGYSENTVVNDRLRGVSSTNSVTNANNLVTSSTAAEAASQGTRNWNNTGIFAVTGEAVFYSFRRAPGFFDVVCYTGDGTSNRQVNHNLTVTPELIIAKRRSAGQDWVAFGSVIGTNNYLILNSTGALNSLGAVTVSASTSTTFGAQFMLNYNDSGVTYVAYLFASVSGVSKVGTYTGNGSNQTINCNFTNGARFILIKRTDSTSDWYVWDTARGIVSGNDPRLSLNSTAAEVTTDDSIDPDNSGFIVNQLSATNINVNAATYIYLAIA